MVPASLNDQFVIRFCVCHEHANDHDIMAAYEIIKQTTISVLCMFPNMYLNSKGRIQMTATHLSQLLKIMNWRRSKRDSIWNTRLRKGAQNPHAVFPTELWVLSCGVL